MRSALNDIRGTTFVEVMTAVVIIGFLASGLQHAAHLILQTDAEAASTRIIYELGTSLLEEVAATAFDDPQTGSTKLSPDDGEWTGLGKKTRSAFDDVDDYTVWDGTYDLQHKDGTAMKTQDYTRAVTVSYVSSTSFDLQSITPTDHKKITVQVLFNKVSVGSFTTVRVQGGRNVDVAS